MQSLEQCYESLSIDTTSWSYYSDSPVSIEYVWHRNEEAYRFIKDFFNYAGKSKVFEDKYLSRNDEYIKERASHTISTFLLGLKLAECFRIDLGVYNAQDMNFKYYWFLACLYHDIGYAFEKKRNRYHIRTVSTEGIEALQEIFGIKYIPDRIFRTYSKSTVEYYLKCRANSDEVTPVIDHGISGGIMLYDKLRSQFKKAWKNRTAKTDSRESFFVLHEATGRRLHLSSSHFDEYAIAADAIITHNIWKSTLHSYQNKYLHITPLANVDMGLLITIDNAICFLLALADTVEPLKKSISLQSVMIESIPNCSGVTLQMDEQTFLMYEGGIEGLRTWVNVTVNVSEIAGSKKSITILAN